MIIAQGAEAILEMENSSHLLTTEGHLVKQRIKKSYRIPEIDEKLRKLRTRSEVSLLNEARRAGVPAPQVLDVKDTEIHMEFIQGKILKELLDSVSIPEKIKLAEEIGKSIALLHSHNIIHGDLTTSNMILRRDSEDTMNSVHGILKEKIYFIDFGLGFQSKRIEDKATDLSVLHESLKAAHFKHLNDLWLNIIQAYKWENSENTLKALQSIEKRGRYKVKA